MLIEKQPDLTAAEMLLAIECVLSGKKPIALKDISDETRRRLEEFFRWLGEHQGGIRVV